ncbi:MAG: hypothetical protein K2J30_00090 [Clostridia bacterium]|nr:hypothetical protein [Clostridia bacterium]
MQNTIIKDGLCLTVDDMGAEPVSVLFQGKERLWQNENGAWTGHAPLLFPVCGNCEVIIDGQRYPFSRHGFARRSLFTLTEKGENYLRYELCDSEETRSVYPFPFKLTVIYKIVNGALEIRYEVTAGDKPLTFSIGAHPCFALDSNLGEYELVFEREEHLVHLVHDSTGLRTGEERDLGTCKVFPISAEQLSEGRTFIFGNVQSRSVLLRKRTGGEVVEYSFEGFSHMLLWRPEGARAICIEPWCNLPGKVDEQGEFAQKQGVISLGAGESRTFFQRMRF